MARQRSRKERKAYAAKLARADDVIRRANALIRKARDFQRIKKIEQELRDAK